MFCSFLYESLITVLVGQEEHPLYFHKELLRRASDFFKAACTGNFKEVDGVVRLPEQDPEIFKYFMYWLYTGKLRGYHYPPTLKPTIKELENAAKIDLDFSRVDKLCELEFIHPHWLAFNWGNYRDVPFHDAIALYILADVLQVHGLKDQVVTVLIDIYGYTGHGERTGTCLPFWDSTPRFVSIKPDWLEGPSKGINMAWGSLPKGCHLRRLLLVLFCDNVMDSDVRTGEEPFDSRFFKEAFEVMAGRWHDRRGTSTWSNFAICQFHDHGVECLLPPSSDLEHITFPDATYLR